MGNPFRQLGARQRAWIAPGAPQIRSCYGVPALVCVVAHDLRDRPVGQLDNR